MARVILAASYMPDRMTGRGEGGHSVIELGMIAVLLVVMSLFCADIGILAMAGSVNDRACRDAARAAAQADNYASALGLAQASVRAHATDGYFIASPAVETGSFVYQDFAGSPPANTSPYVDVTTTTTARVPAPILLWGASFGTGGTISFRRSYTFPIVKTKLYLN